MLIGVSNSFPARMKRLDHRELVVIVQTSAEAELDHAFGGSPTYGPRECFDSSSLSGGGVGPKKGVVDCFFRGFDHGEKEWRRGIVPQGLEITG